MKSYILFGILLLSFTGFAQTNVLSQEISAALSMLNKVRKDAGLDTVSISNSSSKGCINHAKYLVWNRNDPLTDGLKGHMEYPKLKGYSKEGEIAGKNSVIHFVKPTEAIEGWVKTFYHRIPLLHPNLKEVGIGFYEENGYKVCLVECLLGITGNSPKDIVYYPNENQINVPLAMGPELPHPISKEETHGFPITVYFSQYQTVTNVIFKLKNKDEKLIECFVSSPEKPATTFSQENSICAIPKTTLLPNAKYSVVLTCKVNGKAYKKTYSFTTGS